MNIRNTFSILIFVVMLILVKVSVLAGSLQIKESSSTHIVTASPGTNAKWINSEVDTSPDKGQHVSMAIDPSTGEIWVSYYDVTL